MGVFSGDVETRWADDGRSMILLNTLTYSDRLSRIWTAPAGSVVDGASIPRICWILIGSPFVGRYRRASVIHDVYCQNRLATWRATHKVFDEMMQTDTVSWIKRWLMFRAVWFGGPRWEKTP